MRVLGGLLWILRSLSLGGSLWLALAFALGLAAVVAWLAPYFREEWTLWAALVVMVGGFVALSRRRRTRND